jgi:hypothetical protein
MTERRYTDAEIADIFQRAAETPPVGAGPTTPAHGLTLSELQEIGRDVGIPADSIARAALAVGRPDPLAARRFLGLPIGVSHAVPLGRRLSDDEWDRLVVDLREVFGARGRVQRDGSLRQWTNGNLQALVEPTSSGDRLRLRTVKGDAVGMMSLGLVSMAVSGAALAGAAMQGALGDTGMVAALVVLGLAGATAFVSRALLLPRWAATRRAQMEDVAARAVGGGER